MLYRGKSHLLNERDIIEEVEKIIREVRAKFSNREKEDIALELINRAKTIVLKSHSESNTEEDKRKAVILSRKIISEANRLK